MMLVEEERGEVKVMGGDGREPRRGMRLSFCERKPGKEEFVLHEEEENFLCFMLVLPISFYNQIICLKK